jgi:hypothetical protein
VRSDLLRAGRALVLATLGVLFVLLFVPGRLELAIRVFALIVCGVALAVLVSALRRAYPRVTPLRRATSRPDGAKRDVPETLDRLEQEVALGVAGSFDLHHSLRPRLRSIASELLAVRRRVSLDGDPGQARALLGEETWDLVRSDRPRPEDRLARGLPAEAAARVVDSLERV